MPELRRRRGDRRQSTSPSPCPSPSPSPNPSPSLKLDPGPIPNPDPNPNPNPNPNQLTAPIPELLELLDSGEGGAWLDAGGASGASGAGVGRAELRAVQYSARYALTLFFPPAAAATFASKIDWVSRYVAKEEDDALVYLCHDSAKRGGGPSGAPPSLVSLVAHTSVPYGLKTMQASTSEGEVQVELLGRVRKLLPWLPEPASAVLRPWRTSQVRFPLALGVGAACMQLQPPPLAGMSPSEPPPPPLVLAGDAFSPLGSRFDGCVQSGEQAAATLLAALVD